MFKNVSNSPARATSDSNASLSKGRSKKARSPRSQFYSALMTNLGGQVGDDLGAAFTSNDHEKFRSMMQDLADKMAKIEVK